MASNNFIKENFVLVIGLALPVLLVVLFFVASVLPKSLAVPPQYELLFATTEYAYQNPPVYNVDFFVRDGVLKARVSRNNKQALNYNSKKLMVYDGKAQSVRELPYDLSKIGDVADGTEIALEEFQAMKIDGATKAPDGYSFDSPGYSSGGLVLDIFGNRYRSGARVVKGMAAFKIPNADRDRYYGYDVQFLGWVISK